MPADTHISDSRARIYGEVSAVGARQLLGALALRPGDRFVDLGSGVGKLVLHVALAVPGVPARGIEIDGRRHAGAQAVLARAIARGLIPEGACAFEHADVRRADLAGTTVAFANSTCFPDPLLSAVAARLAGLSPPLLFASLKELEGQTARGFEAAGVVPCATSWDRHMTAHLYRLAAS